MYHNEFCSFPAGFNQKKKCNHKCEYWVTCTRKNSYEWETYLKGLKSKKPTSSIQKQRELMNREAYRHEIHKQELISEIDKINKILRRHKND